jgi:hypothetical protein
MHGEEDRVLYNILKDFQSGIVGILGFAGVIITLWWNAHLARISRVQQIDQTRLTMQTALRTELQSVREELANLDRAFKENSAQPIRFTLEPPYVYPKLVKDIGTLESEQAKTMIRVHRNLYLLLNAIRERAVDPSKALATIERENFSKTAPFVAAALDETDMAIKALTHASG